jgi:hypothetical protein
MDIWRQLGIPPKGVYTAIIRCHRIVGRYDTSSGLRPRIPNHKQYLLYEEINGLNGDRNDRAIYVDIWVEDGYPISQTSNAILNHLDTVMVRAIVADVGNHTVTTV